jgi:hypothetical protein
MVLGALGTICVFRADNLAASGHLFLIVLKVF